MKTNESIEFKITLTKDQKINFSTSWNFKGMSDADKLEHIDHFARILGLLQRAKLIQYIRQGISEYGIIHKDNETSILLLEKQDEKLQDLLISEMGEMQARVGHQANESDNKPIFRSIDAFTERDEY